METRENSLDHCVKPNQGHRVYAIQKTWKIPQHKRLTIDVKHFVNSCSHAKHTRRRRHNENVICNLQIVYILIQL